MTGLAYNTGYGTAPGLDWSNWMQAGMGTPAAAPAAVPVAPAAPVVPVSMPMSSALSWGSGLGAGIAAAPTPVPAADSGGLMGFLRGQPGVSGDGLTGWLGNGQNLGTLVNGLSALSSAWLGYNQLKLAKDQFGFQKEAFQKNFANQTKNYNTSLEDRIRGRTADYAGKESDVQAYLNKHRLST